MASKENDKSTEAQNPDLNPAKGKPDAAKFDAKWLTGKTYRTTQAKKQKDEAGKEITVRVPVERPLTQGDLLDWQIIGAQVVLVTKDGRKYRMPK
ncbi:MAG: hypothetical protein HY911_04475 [Desulfobacterales bacterium]|nr:hypothetical protein [Desulfobacterales bacterium]